ncbi:tetratricopeptide repeat protein [Thermaerobacillus caldiproteolyticus]|uniref:tetratricopeptide repeat protein n=1 Tax=Thermaerobacillus caldiproteolyticus TaxID=247480 RepID=UPI0018F205D8|nr:tetratricopeptide repeat protein [Anoxybacillus caldiproteolyticus]
MGKDDKRLKEQEGVHYFAFLCSRLGFLFREVLHHDKGVDCEIEITTSLGLDTQIVAVQIKSRSEVYVTQKNEISLTVSQQNIDYWKNYGRPVILVVYTNAQEPLYWTRVDNLESKNVKVPLENQFNKETIHDLSRILIEYHREKSKSLKLKEIHEVLEEFGEDLNDIVDPIVESLKNAKNLFFKQKFKQAAEIYQSIANIYKKNCLIYYNLGICLLHLNKVDTVFEIAENLYREFPNRYEPLKLLGSAYAAIGNYFGAEQFLLKALKIQPESPDIWNSIGLINYHQGKYSEAIKAFLFSLKLHNDSFTHFNLALCYTAVNNYQYALQHYDEAIQLNEEFYDAYNNKGLLLKDLWRISEAIDNFKRAIDLDPENVKALFNYAYLLKDLGKNDKAIYFFSQALENNPNNEHIHLNLGLLYCRIENYNSASYHFKKCIRMLGISKKNLSKPLKIGISDIGYEVAFLITLEINPQFVVKVVDVKSIPELALYKGVPQMRSIVDFAQKNQVTKPMTPIVQSKLLRKHKEKQLRKIHKKNKRKLKENKNGIWFFGISTYAFAVFTMEDYRYYNKVIKEIKRRVRMEGNTEDEKLLQIEYEGHKYDLLYSEKTDLDNKVEVKIERRISEEVYFNINFNGYYLASISDGFSKEALKNFKESYEQNKYIVISLSCVSENNIVNHFAIKVKRVIFKL